MKEIRSRAERLGRSQELGTTRARGQQPAFDHVRRLHNRSRLGGFLERNASQSRSAVPLVSAARSANAAGETPLSKRNSYPAFMAADRVAVQRPRPINTASTVKAKPTQTIAASVTTSNPFQGWMSVVKRERSTRSAAALTVKTNRQSNGQAWRRTLGDGDRSARAHPDGKSAPHTLNFLRPAYQSRKPVESSLKVRLQDQLAPVGLSDAGRRVEAPSAPALRSASRPLTAETMLPPSAGVTRASTPGLHLAPGGPLHGPGTAHIDGRAQSDGSSSDVLLLTGEIVVDGRRLGQIVARRQARELNAAPATSSAISLRSTPLNPGVSIPVP